MESITNWVTIHFTTWYGYLIAIFAGIGGLWELWDKVGGRIILKLWPNTLNWTATSNMNENITDLPIRGAGRWCTGLNQKVDDYYQIDMHKNRLISRFKLVSYENRYPKKYRIQICRDDSTDFQDLGVQNGPIDYKFPKPRKFKVVKITIVEPDILTDNAMHSWCIYELQFWETRLFRWSFRIKNR